MITKLKSLQEHQGFMRYFKNTSWIFAEKILRMAASLLVGIWVTRYLGPEQFGLLAYSQSFVWLFAAFATLGLDGIVVREFIKNDTNSDELIGTVFRMRIVAALLVIGLILIILTFSSNDLQTKILISIIASGTVFQSFNVIDMYFQSKVLSKYVVYANIISLLISSLVKISLIIFNAPLIAFAWVILFDSFILALGFIYFYIKNNSKFNLKNYKFNKTLAVSLLKDSWPLILSGLVISIYMRIDQVMIKEMLNAEEVGIYSVAVRVSELWYFIPLAIVNSLFPAIVNAKKTNTKVYYDRLQKLYDFMVWIAIAIALPMTFFSDWVINLLFGEEYIRAGSILTIHIWTGIFVFLGLAFSQYLLTENLNKKAFYRSLLGAVMNVILNFILIPKYGIKGAAIATLIGQFSANYLYDFFDKDLHHQLIMKTKSFNLIRIIKNLYQYNH